MCKDSIKLSREIIIRLTRIEEQLTARNEARNVVRKDITENTFLIKENKVMISKNSYFRIFTLGVVAVILSGGAIGRAIGIFGGFK